MRFPVWASRLHGQRVSMGERSDELCGQLYMRGNANHRSIAETVILQVMITTDFSLTAHRDPVDNGGSGDKLVAIKRSYGGHGIRLTGYNAANFSIPLGITTCGNDSGNAVSVSSFSAKFHGDNFYSLYFKFSGLPWASCWGRLELRALFWPLAFVLVL